MWASRNPFASVRTIANRCVIVVCLTPAPLARLASCQNDIPIAAVLLWGDRELATRDLEASAVNVARGGGTQQGDRAGDVFGIGGATQRGEFRKTLGKACVDGGSGSFCGSWRYGIGQVGGDETGFVAGLFDFPYSFGASVGAAAVHHHFGAETCELQRDRAADARGGSRDQCRRARQCCCHVICLLTTRAAVITAEAAARGRARVAPPD